MASSLKKYKAIHSEAREMINGVNYQCKEAAEKSLISTVYRGDERTANCYGVLFATVKQIGREDRQINYAGLKSCSFTKSITPPPPNVLRSELSSE